MDIHILVTEDPVQTDMQEYRGINIMMLHKKFINLPIQVQAVAELAEICLHIILMSEAMRY